jgi:hypothetical protein
MALCQYSQPLGIALLLDLLPAPIASTKTAAAPVTGCDAVEFQRIGA